MTYQTITSRRRQPFIWIDLALDDFDLGVDAFRVYVHLCRRAGKDGNAFPSYSSIGEHCFRADSPKAKPESLRRRAMRAIQELIEKELIEQERRTGKSGQYTSNHYWINDLKEIASDCKSPPLVTDNHYPSDCKSPPLVTDNHYPSDCKSPAYIEVDPIETDPIETDPDKHPPTPQKGEVSEADFSSCELVESEPCQTQLTNDTKQSSLTEQKKDLGEDKYSALARTDPFLARKSGLSYQCQKALNESLVGSPFASIEEQDEFYSQHLNYIRATSPKLNPGQITAIAKASLKRLMGDRPDPEDRRVLTLWQNGQLARFQGLAYDPQAIAREKQRAKSLEILEKIQKGESLYDS